jgi:threonine synthase
MICRLFWAKFRSVDKEAIHAAQRGFAWQGFYVEPTSATAVAALPTVFEIVKSQQIIVVPLTGGGSEGSSSVEHCSAEQNEKPCRWVVCFSFGLFDVEASEGRICSRAGLTTKVICHPEYRLLTSLWRRLKGCRLGFVS